MNEIDLNCLAAVTIARSGKGVSSRPYPWLSGKTATIIWLGVVLVCTGVSCSRIAISTSGYRGDGAISTKWFPFNPLISVDFDTFSLAKPYEATYSLEGLPYHPSGYLAGFIARTSATGQVPSDLTTGPFGDFSLRLTNAEGNVVFECKGSVEDLAWIWGQSDEERMGLPFHAHEPKIAQSLVPASDFNEPSRLPDKLTVSYMPRTHARNLEVHVRLRAGGYK